METEDPADRRPSQAELGKRQTLLDGDELERGQTGLDGDQQERHQPIGVELERHHAGLDVDEWDKGLRELDVDELAKG